MTKKQKLELTWVGKENRPRLEPRILLEDPARSYHAPHRIGDDDIFDNRLIFGDNLLALKALEQEFSGKVKCVFIDPPYNTGSAFEHYDDGVEHSIWLSLIRDRLELIRRMLSEDGSVWITIDDNEAHYLKILCDEIFGRANFIASVIWQKLYTVKNSARFFSDMHEYVLIYAKSSDVWNRNLLPRSEELDSGYSNQDDDPRGPWTTNAIQARNFYSQGTYEIKSPAGRIFVPPTGTYWRVSRTTFEELEADQRIWWGRGGTAIPRIKKFLSEAKQGVVPATLWFHDDVGTNAEAKLEIRNLYNDVAEADVFMTPKPERLLKRIIEIATNPGDIVLDFFAGSGTTGAVAHKMGRRWIMVELGVHCHTHIIPRLKKIINGEDKGGVTEATRWEGGGGFRYFQLAPTLLETDRFGREVISKAYNAEMLTEALCKLEGFTYFPSDTVYWQHGSSTERDFLYVTTQTLSQDQLAHLSDEVGPDRSLLVLCSAFRGNPAAFSNLTVKKIPNHVKNRCEWGHDDYSLNVENLPKAPPIVSVKDDTVAEPSIQPSKQQTDLFGSDGSK